MRVARIVAFIITALGLAVAVLVLVMPVRTTFSTGVESYSWSCGSAAFPKDRVEYDRMDDILNCTGATPASAALWGIGVAMVGLAAVAVTTWRIDRTRRSMEPPAPA